MPQFNWPILGPIILAAAAAVAGVLFLFSRVPPIATQPASAANRTSASLQHPGPRFPGRVIGTPHLRTQPSSNAQVLQDLQSGELVDVSACNTTCGWFLVGAPGSPPAGWVPSAFVSLQGDEQKLAVAK